VSGTFVGESHRLIKVLLIDDSVALRSAWAKLIERTLDFKLVGSIGTESEIIATVRATHPDVVMLDLSVIDEPSLDTVHTLTRETPNARILVYSGRDPREVLPRICAAGVAGFIGKQEEPARVIEAIRRVAQGESVSPEGIVLAAPDIAIKPGYTPCAPSGSG